MSPTSLPPFTSWVKLAQTWSEIKVKSEKRNRLVNKNGLVANHAYTIFDTARVQNKNNHKVDLLRILSPHSDRSKISKCKSRGEIGRSLRVLRTVHFPPLIVTMTGTFKIIVGMDIGQLIVLNGILWIQQWNLDYHMVAKVVTFGCPKMTGSSNSNQWQFVLCQISFQITTRGRYVIACCTYVYTHTSCHKCHMPVWPRFWGNSVIVTPNMGWIVVELWFLGANFFQSKITICPR